MKKFLATTCITLLLVCTFSSLALAKNILIINGCGFTLNFVGLSHSSQKNVENLLDEPLKADEGLNVELNTTSNIDLTVQDTEGNQVDFHGLNLKNVSKITLHADGTADLE